ncbi:hypothetical protein VPNG_03762 [Cytospora leucostoma]|uniref:Uncharacterized protein n=1 Tax=Cytospora leucostoma TaxID=1230097 RepID=A0A423XEU6_9PEZI|nr:hypothetical protein VPNG_03762 [Cytospora leucostoma]
MTNPIVTLGLSCPDGGKFYVCQDSKFRFLGCCSSDPCADGSGDCPQSDLRYSSFDAGKYENISAQDCTGDGDWYTCSGLDIPFLGCCSSDACSNDDGCPTKNLLAAELSSNIASAEIFSSDTILPAKTAAQTITPTTITRSGTTTSTSYPIVSSSGTPSTASLSSIVTPTNTSTPASDASPTGLSNGAIAGISVAGAVCLLALFAVLFFFGRRKWMERRGVVVKGSQPPTPSALMSYPATSYLYQDLHRSIHTSLPVQSPDDAVVNDFLTHSSSRTNSVKSWLSYASRRASMNSNHHARPARSSITAPNNWQGPAISSATPGGDIEQQQHPPFIPHSQPLATLAELDGTGISRPPSELPGDDQPQHTPVYRPYRPSVGSARGWVY